MTTLATEEPFASAVEVDYLPFTCSKCFAWNPADRKENEAKKVNLQSCAGCKVVNYCNAKCQKDDWKDHKKECKNLKRWTSKYKNLPIGTVRLVARMLQHPEDEDVEAFNGFSLACLMTRCEQEKRSTEKTETAKGIHRDILEFTGENYPLDRVWRAVSTVNTSGFNIKDATPECMPRGRGIYIGLAVHDHSCRPNGFIVNEGSKLLFRTEKKDLSYSTDLTISFQPLKFVRDTKKRQANLKRDFMITCDCEECEDFELDKKRLSGKPTCCPTGWFAESDSKCSECGKTVPADRVQKLKAANAAIGQQLTYCDEDFEKADVISWPILLATHKSVMSDYNTNVFGLFDMFTSVHWDSYVNGVTFNNLQQAKIFTDICLPMLRERPVDEYKAYFLVRRGHIYEKEEPNPAIVKEVFKEALETVKIMYGDSHELTQYVKQKAT